MSTIYLRDSTVTLYREVPYTEGYLDVPWWTDETSRLNTFNSLYHPLGFLQCSYIKVNPHTQFDVALPISSTSWSNALAYNYCIISNPSYENKKWFCFIDSCDYINDDVVNFKCVLDLWNTYFFDFEVKKGTYIDRWILPWKPAMPHQNSSMGQPTAELLTAEDFTPAYVVNDAISSIDSALQTDASNDHCLIVLYNQIQNGDPFFSNTSIKPYCYKLSPEGLGTSATKTDIFGTVYAVIIPMYSTEATTNQYYASARTAVRNLLLNMTSTELQSVVQVSMYPKSSLALAGCVNRNSGTAYTDYSGSTIISVEHQYKLKHGRQNGTQYTPMNEKLDCYPYKAIKVSTFNGNSMILNQDAWACSNGKYKLRWVGGSVFERQGSIYPVNYDGEVEAYNKGINTAVYPTCPWGTDTSALLLAQENQAATLNTLQLQKTNFNTLVEHTDDGLWTAIGSPEAERSIMQLQEAGYATEADNSRYKAYLKTAGANSVQDTLLSGLSNLPVIGSMMGKNGANTQRDIVANVCNADYDEAYAKQACKSFSMQGGEAQISHGYAWRRLGLGKGELLSLTYEQAWQIDCYFQKWGYTCNAPTDITDLVHGRQREYLMYVKTKGCQLYNNGNIPMDVQETLQAFFDRGIRWWYQPSVRYQNILASDGTRYQLVDNRYMRGGTTYSQQWWNTSARTVV